ncbi:hypothetical protein H5410_038488 [Solanum commersonii]|uniref:Uncharacterized protein n=1 Tax=Solanum commersonii TaxID=4109 RepID=A0A9J5YCF5_SOLCO|nr:hypothetical protein H5410_038488 [Solanum commersonii]
MELPQLQRSQFRAFLIQNFQRRTETKPSSPTNPMYLGSNIQATRNSFKLGQARVIELISSDLNPSGKLEFKRFKLVRLAATVG